jgi:DNA-directed RNA polymerase specialized sigma24 family protein
VDISPSKKGSEKRGWVLTEGDFNRLLAWLDQDRERAGEKYEKIRLKLVKIFVCRGCAVPEDLADETINRVTRKIHEIADTYVGDPVLYFSNVAQKIYLEHIRKKPDPLPMPEADPVEEDEPEYECLDQCMQRLTPNNRELILEYYRDEKQAKIESRKRLADRLGINLNALRIRTNRIRVSLEDCVKECIKQK